ncbi:tRNA uridine-5-carboxymethylaminomethyl(34) synthesis GTPase MnmE [Silvanigrella aquatica]|uniref:tRNA modification GTPase MnmE n=1 Tax=Silvanigrella aquatica TaxID=1915309 RepID=A0A1L4D191_9BACT|nr:tRNA uridine-5-carboxymethylaminomethyl(34) synthesis GTPase MnmE [Silvanigrella aquatica]APJ03958.1 tRNA uridine-5-carboxymethylaminomethyl(34) synthesis GTPase MnmE [Silvanigrella aquatica]
MSSSFDSIFALASPSVRSAIHLHRISGRNLIKIISPYIFSPNGKNIYKLNYFSDMPQDKPLSRYVLIKDQNGEMIDDVILTYFPAPKSYTGEDVIEISVHGNPLISAKLHSLLRNIGMRDAEPGEFTQRAVLNGKLDLAQAEGINQLIHTETLGGIHLARNTVDGVLSKETEDIREQLIGILSYLEAHIDFAPDEVGDYDPVSLLPQMKNAIKRLEILLGTYSSGLKLREGIKVALVGKPNAGKSSLYNSLLRYDRAIVTNIPGTTRDVLEDRLVIQNKDFVLIDTAGIRHTSDTVEKMGVERSLKTVAIADIICLVINIENIQQENINNYILSELNQFIHEVNIHSNQKILVVISKKDLLLKKDIHSLQWLDENSILNIDKKFNMNCLIQKFIFTSIDDNESLSQELVNLHNEMTGQLAKKENPALISTRQKDKVEIAIKCLNEAIELVEQKDYPEKISSIINQSRQSLQEIVGEIHLDNVLEKIFSTFCIGK